MYMVAIKKKKQFTLICICIGVLLLIGGYIAYSVLSQESKEQSVEKTIDYAELSKNLKEATSNAPDSKNLVEEYGKEYDAFNGDVMNTEPSKWNKEHVEKASFMLLYAQSIGAKSQVQVLLGKLQAAADAGVSVNDNSSGLTDQERAAMTNETKIEVVDSQRSTN